LEKSWPGSSLKSPAGLVFPVRRFLVEPYPPS
jgi:hypothetical protein